MASVTVFDTNVYQSTSPTRLEKIVASESREGIQAYADSWVMIELIAKLRDPRERPRARSALRKQLTHCGDEHPRMLIDCEEQICRFLLNVASPGYAERRDHITSLVEYVARAPDADDLSSVLPAVCEIAANVDEIERERATKVLDMIRRLVPGAESWDAIAKDPEIKDKALTWIASDGAIRTLASAEVLKAYSSARLPRPAPLPIEMVNAIVRHFRYPLEVELRVIRNVLEHGGALTGRGRQNSVWDAQIAFNAGQIVDKGRRITLVTDDRLLLDVARRTNTHSVQTSAEYLEHRGIAA